MPRLITRLQGTTLRRVQLPSIKEPFLLGCQRRKYSCCVILLDLLKMTELSNWIWIWRGVKDFCPVFLPAAPGDGRQISVSQHEGQVLFPLFFLWLVLLMVIFPILKTRGFFIKSDGKDRARKGTRSCLLSSSLSIYWHKSITTVPTQVDSLAHIPGSISAIPVCEMKRVFSPFHLTSLFSD